jgi:magnesium transporter
MIEREELLAVVRETYRLRRILIDFRRGLRNYIQMLREIHSDQNMARYIKNLGRLLELIDELSIGLETLEIYREMLISIRETHATLVGVKLNEVVKRLTAIILVLMIPTLIASIYGMSLDRSYPLNMPELSWSFGYIYALGLMVVSSIAGYLILKARGRF